MMMVIPLSLPTALPHPDAIKSSGENVHSYDPEFWEFQYKMYRYLSRISDDSLLVRHEEIIRNMKAIVSDDRHVIPIFSFLSSWYWYRKEHQTRYEIAIRKLPVNRDFSVLATRDLMGAPARPRYANAGDVLFRFGEARWLEELIQFGRLRVRAAREYAQMESDPARRDDEVMKHWFIPGQHTKVTTEDGRELKILGDVRSSVSGADYFVYCVSCDWDPKLFDDFQADCCLVISNVVEFSRRLQHAAASQLSNWHFHHNPIQYFDPYERTSKERIDNAMSKDFRFAYQREYRFLFTSFQGLPAEGFKSLELGPLDDIACLHTK